jgi:osmoprotectant transport system ATP-binding protein
MDEPFGAVDPIARDRLQAEFLRLQHQVRKTVVFVTHDIDEAIRVGDRIAVMRDGGHLEQYDAPDRLLAAPATAFVADFVGSERTLRRLSVLDIDVTGVVDWPRGTVGMPAREALARMQAQDADWLLLCGDGAPRWLARDAVDPAGAAGDAAVPAGVVGPGETLEAALAALLAHDGPGVVVVDGDGAVLGVLPPARLLAGARRARATVSD